MMITRQLFYLIAALFIAHNAVSQSKISEIELLIEEGKALQKSNDSIAIIRFKRALQLAEQNSLSGEIALANHGLGQVYLDRENYSKAQVHLFEALKIYEDDESLFAAQMADCKLNIGTVFYYTRQYKLALDYSLGVLDYYLLENDSVGLSRVHSNIGASYSSMEDYDKSIMHGKKALTYFNGEDSSRYAQALMNLSTDLYDIGDLDTSYIITKQALEVYEALNDPEGVGEMYYQLGLISESQNNIDIAIAFYHKSLAICDSIDFKDLKRSTLEGLMLCQGTLGNTDSLYHYYYTMVNLQNKINKEFRNSTINELRIQYESEKKEEESKLLKAENAYKDEQIKSDKNAILLLAISIVLVLLITVVIIIYLRQKQLLTKLELKQKNDEVMRIMKEQEVLAYESLLEGETLERTRVARELHDRVGGLLATINLHCESLRTNMAISRIDQMQNLIKDTIQEVRTISHNLEGDLDTSGLHSTLEHLQEAIDSSGRIKFGLYYELGNYKPPLSLSREIVKIIQELVTNTIKHADASSITTQLSNPGDHLQIIYEDDGKGFETSSAGHGIGMKNIEQRLISVKGSWNVDSQPGHGTTVVIEIPLSA